VPGQWAFDIHERQTYGFSLMSSLFPLMEQLHPALLLRKSAGFGMFISLVCCFCFVSVTALRHIYFFCLLFLFCEVGLQCGTRPFGILF